MGCSGQLVYTIIFRKFCFSIFSGIIRLLRLCRQELAGGPKLGRALLEVARPEGTSAFLYRRGGRHRSAVPRVSHVISRRVGRGVNPAATRPDADTVELPAPEHKDQRHPWRQNPAGRVTTASAMPSPLPHNAAARKTKPASRAKPRDVTFLYQLQPDVDPQLLHL